VNHQTANHYLKLLKKLYPKPKTALSYRSQIQFAVAVVLSAQSTDKMVNQVSKDLFKRYRTVADFADATLSEFENEIKQIGLYRNKAKNIIAMAKMLRDDYKSRLPQSIDELQKLPGVGRKTANVIQGVLFGNPEGIAVDTHVTRLAGRLGLTKHKDPKKIETDLMKWFEQNEWVEVSHLLILHGRNVCDARKPRCSACTLADVCPQIGVKQEQMA